MAEALDVWTNRNGWPALPAFSGIASGDGTIAAVGPRGDVATSDDGRSWTHRNSGVTNSLNLVAGAEPENAGPPIIDIMIIYTPATTAAHGDPDGISALIALAVAEVNELFDNSLINARLRLIHKQESAHLLPGGGAVKLACLAQINGQFVQQDERRLAAKKFGQRLRSGCRVAFVFIATPVGR